MQLELLEKEGSSWLLKVVGEDHTLPNLLRVELHEDENVIAASYSIEHPLVGSPKIFVKTKGKSPEKAILSAAERILEDLEEAKKEFQKSLKLK